MASLSKNFTDAQRTSIALSPPIFPLLYIFAPHWKICVKVHGSGEQDPHIPIFCGLWRSRNLGSNEKKVLPQEGYLSAILKQIPQIYQQSPVLCWRGMYVLSNSRRGWTHLPLEFWELLFVSSKLFCALPSTLLLKALSAGWRTKQRRWLVKSGHGNTQTAGKTTCSCATNPE